RAGRANEATAMEETPFYRIRLTADEAEELEQRRRTQDMSPFQGLWHLLRFSAAHGCAPLGRLDPTDVVVGGVASPTLGRTCQAVAATQQGYDFRTICHIFHPPLDPWLHAESAALLSGDGRFGVLVQYFQREREEELVYSCTSALANGRFVATRFDPSDLFDPPEHGVAAAPSPQLKDILAVAPRRITTLSVVPFTAAQVPGAVLAMNLRMIDYNVEQGRFVPLSARAVERIRAAMRRG